MAGRTFESVSEGLDATPGGRSVPSDASPASRLLTRGFSETRRYSTTLARITFWREVQSLHSLAVAATPPRSRPVTPVQRGSCGYFGFVGSFLKCRNELHGGLEEGRFRGPFRRADFSCTRYFPARRGGSNVPMVTPVAYKGPDRRPTTAPPVQCRRAARRRRGGAGDRVCDGFSTYPGSAGQSLRGAAAQPRQGTLCRPARQYAGSTMPPRLSRLSRMRPVRARAVRGKQKGLWLAGSVVVVGCTHAAPSPGRKPSPGVWRKRSPRPQPGCDGCTAKHVSEADLAAH